MLNKIVSQTISNIALAEFGRYAIWESILTLGVASQYGEWVGCKAEDRTSLYDRLEILSVIFANAICAVGGG